MIEDDLVVENNIVAAFKRTASGETITKQQRMQNDIEVYNKTQVNSNVAVRINPDFRVSCKTKKKNVKSGKKSDSKMVIAELRKRAQRYNLINSLVEAQADITYGHITG